MSRRKAEVPSLADALAKGFADLKAGEEETPPVEEVIKTTEALKKKMRQSQNQNMVVHPNMLLSKRVLS